MTFVLPKVARRPKHPTGEVLPASKSMFKSSLYHKDQWVVPEMKGLTQVQLALEQDAESQVHKYGTEGPSFGSARFNVCLPQGPQNKKYCSSNSPRRRGGVSSNFGQEQKEQMLPILQSALDHRKPKAAQGLKFNKHTLHTLFRGIDSQATGFVTPRAVIVMLQKKLAEDLMAADTRREVTSWLREVIREVDVDNNGYMCWKEFLEFFRHAGMLLEYQDENDPKELLRAQLEAAQADMKKISMADPAGLLEGMEKLSSELRTTRGTVQVARFKKNRRAGSPTGAQQSDDSDSP